ncbi:MAG: protein-export chaperone SecB [Gammaproteobacteria bacterium]|nr:MAG: protein-export chaperone SecB [Gammaproteobacteria bacterium]
MADENTNPQAGAAEGQSEGLQFRIQRVYLKDVSYESPQTPHIFVTQTNWQPNVSLHLNTESSKLDNDMYECVLTVTATVKLQEETAYLVEVKQGGLFLIKGFDEKRLGAMLGSYCPNILFPFAREEIASLVLKGGFPQLVLDPVNFDALYAQHLEKGRQNAPAPETQQ